MDKPKLCCTGNVFETTRSINTNKFGGTVAAPVVAKIIERLIKNEDITSKENSRIKSKQKRNKKWKDSGRSRITTYLSTDARFKRHEC